jgi:hypothetical protein
MSEQQYIDATNLAKLRIALQVIRDTLPMRADEETIHLSLRKQLRAWIQILEPIVAPMEVSK